MLVVRGVDSFVVSERLICATDIILDHHHHRILDRG